MTTKKCPYCAEQIQEEAVKCRFCGSWVSARGGAGLSKRLTRSADERMLAGICGGIARMMNVDPTIVRILIVVLGVVTAIIPALVIYLVIIFIIPSDLDPLRGL